MSRYVDVDALMQNIPNEEMIAKMAVAHAPTIKTKQTNTTMKTKTYGK